MRCWAFGPDMRRCDADTMDHPARHSYTVEWEDEESLTFEGLSAVVEAKTLLDHPTPIHDAVLIDQAVQTLDNCYTCGCTQAQHEVIGGDNEAMCVPHQCRTFMA
jgi:hypothetical protein